MSKIADAALEYMEQGFSVIPVDRQTKKPLVPWKKYQEEYPTEEEIEAWWVKYPDANVGIVTGKLSGLAVVDADSEAGGQWVTNHCQKTTVYVKTSNERFHSYYLYPYTLDVKNAVRIAPDVDIRGEGGYVVAPPSIHASGHQYEFVFMGDGFDDMPEFTPVNGFAKMFEEDSPQQKKGNLNVNLGGVKESPVNEGVAKGGRNNKLAQLGGQWIAKGLDYDEALALAKSWNSTNSPPMGERELKKTLKSVMKIHKENHACTEIPITPELEAAEDEPEDGGLPQHILSPGGILGMMIDYIESTTTVSIPLFSLGTAISGLGSVLGQNVMTETGLRTNMYIINLGYSGSGKDGAIKAIPKLLRRTDAAGIVGPSEIASEASLFRWLETPDRRKTFLCLDEIGQVLAGMQNPNSPQAGIPRLLTKLFSGTDSPEMKIYADQKNNIILPWHHVSLSGATTPERWWESIRPSEVADGFLARCMIFEYLGIAPMPKTGILFTVPQPLIDAVNSLFNIKIKMHMPGNIPNNHVPIPNVIPKTADAVEYFQEFAQKYHDLKNQHRQNTLGIASIYGRAAEHASKTALIHAFSCGGACCTAVGLDSVKWACELVDILVTNLVKSVVGSVSDTDTGKWKNKILKGIRAYSFKNRKKGYSGATLRDLQRGPGQGLKSKELNDIITSMVLAETIGKSEFTAGNGRKVHYFYVAK